MRIKIIGDNNCARATRHLLRLAGFAVTEFLPVDAISSGPHAGYTITIDLAPCALDHAASLDLSPATHTPDLRHHPPKTAAEHGGEAHLRPDSPAQHHAPAQEEALRAHRGASSPAFSGKGLPAGQAGSSPSGLASTGGSIHFDSVESALETAVLRHVTQLAAAPVIVDRPGGVVHSDREMRIVAPNTGDAKADEAAAVAIEFGVLRGMLDLTVPATQTHAPNKGHAEGPASSPEKTTKKKWWPFGIALMVLCSAGVRAVAEARGLKSSAADRISALLTAEPPQGQFATGQGFRITDGNNFLWVDPCKGQAKSYASISQTANTQLVAGTVSKKIYVCSIHVVVAAATNVAVVEGTGATCGTGTSGVGGFGGATAGTGWNFAANGGIAFGNGDSSLGAEVTSGDNLCIFNSGSGQVSGGISYVVQ